MKKILLIFLIVYVILFVIYLICKYFKFKNDHIIYKILDKYVFSITGILLIPP